nr:MAG TPA: hypothetical protein [Caudoviricetes sp.]
MRRTVHTPNAFVSMGVNGQNVCTESLFFLV